MVDGNVQVYFVAARAESRNLARLFVEGLEGGGPVRLGIELHVVVMQPSQQWVPAFRELCERRILDFKMTLPHGAAYVNDRVAGHAPQSILAFRGIFDFANGMFLHLPGQNQRVIMTTTAPKR